MKKNLAFIILGTLTLTEFGVTARAKPHSPCNFGTCPDRPAPMPRFASRRF
jgi:hypothetical protein